MLFEGLTYAADFPMNIQVVHVTEDPLHYHVDVEFVYVLRGKVQLTNGCHSYVLRDGDVFTNVGHEVHSLSSLSEDNVVAILQISTHYFSRYFPNLSQSVYRSYSQRSDTKKHDRLRGLLLQILLKYAVKNSNYKSECISLVVDTIKHMNKYFNLFAFDKDLVVSFDRGNALAVERISRIYTYIYQYYADNITLEDLSEMEHLSSYYLSHLIKSFTGLNFRELLCFARVAWSQIRLLEGSSKISRVAREVGFSTLAYYEKYFEKWFHTTPQAYRDAYLPAVKSELRPAVLTPLPQDQMIAVIRSVHANYNLKQGESALLSVCSVEATVNVNAPPLFRLDKRLTVRVTLDDYKALGFTLLTALAALTPAKVVLDRRERDSAEELRSLTRLLRGGGFAVEKGAGDLRCRPAVAACDTVAYPIHLLKKHVKSRQSQVEVCLRDSDQDGRILQGQEALFTAGGIRKPSFYAYQILSSVRGDVLAWAPQYCVVRVADGARGTMAILSWNDSDALEDICLRGSDPRQVKTVLDDFQNEIRVNVNLNLPRGMYAVTRYSLDRGSNIFAYLATLDFQERALLPKNRPEDFSASPSVETYIEDARAVFNLTFSFKGAGLQAAAVKGIDLLR